MNDWIFTVVTLAALAAGSFFVGWTLGKKE